MLKLTVNPDPGYAVKELFYTYNGKTNTLYVLFPKFPYNRKLELKNVSLPPGIGISFLATGETVSWEARAGNTVVTLPEYHPDKIRAPYAYVLKIENFGRFAPKPKITVDYKKGSFEPTVSITGDTATSIVYNLDNADGPVWKAYQRPIGLNHTAIVKAKALSKISNAVLPSEEVEVKALKYDWMTSLKVRDAKPGLLYRYFEPAGEINLHSAEQDQSFASGTVDVISVAKKQRAERFAFRFEGYVLVAQDGLYDFFLKSDDGSTLWVDNREVINNDGSHGAVEKNGKTVLRKGYHSIKVLYFDGGGDNELKVSFQPDGGRKEELRAGSLWH